MLGLRYDLFSTTGKDAAPLDFSATTSGGASSDQLFVVQADKVRYDEISDSAIATASPGTMRLTTLNALCGITYDMGHNYAHSLLYR